jgi:NADH-quinone oxidoreductase subunit E
LLHLVQAEEGFVSSAGIEFCADMLDLSTAEVAGVATFYTMYRRKPGGTYSVGVCTNTLCAVLGGDEIFDTLKGHLGIGHNQTTEDGKVTLEHLECNAACDYAPVMMVNWEFFDNQTPQSAVQLVDDLRSGNKVRPTRGPRLCTFTEVSRVLAGFPDGLADEGPSAGPATLVGLRIAQDRGDVAPQPERSGADSWRDAQQTETPPAPADAPAADATPSKEKAAARKTASRKSAGEAPAKKAPAKKVAARGGRNRKAAVADVRTAAAESSAHDAGLSTAQSDPANEAAPAEDHE